MPTQNPRSVFSRTLQVLFTFTLTLLLAEALPSVALAKEGTKSYSIESGPATTTLKEFAEQSGRSVLFSTEKVQGISTNAIKGELTAEEALDRLLSGTRLSAVPEKSTGGFAIRREVSVEVAEKNDSSRPANSRAADNVQDGVVKLDTFEVFGRKTLNMDIRRSEDDPQPYVVFDRQAIDRSGAVNLQDFLQQRLPMDTNRFSNSQAGSAATGNGSYFNLRGLGVNQTLILIDGHRTASASQSGTPIAVDLNGIPLAAVERIEVLPTTASAIYGGSATGGVINVILRRDYAGAEVKFTYDNTFDSDSAVRTVDFSAGFNLEGGKTSVLLIGSYSDANALVVQDRGFLQRARAAVLANTGGNYQAHNLGTIPPVGFTTNIRSADGSNLTLKNGTPLNSPITFVPVGYAGTASDGGAALVANAGRYNLDPAAGAESSGGGSAGLLNSPRVSSLGLTVRRQFSPSFQMFLDGFMGRNHGRYLISPAVAATIPAASAINPFNQNISVRVPVRDSDFSWQDVESRRVVAGAIVGLPREWKAEADFTWSDSTYDSFTEASINTAAAVPTGAVDVLRDINAHPIDWSPHRLGGPFVSYLSPSRIESKVYTVRLAGPTFTLPGGPVVLAGLVERKEDGFDETRLRQVSTSTIFITVPARSQAFNSAYVETTLPFVSEPNRRRGMEELKLQLGARWDEFKVNGSTASLIGVGAPSTAPVSRSSSTNDSVNVTAALSYKPVPSLTLRASAGTGFLPPSANQVLSSGLSSPLNGAFLVDPRRGNTSVGFYQSLSGGDPGIRPEESKSWSAGAILLPEAVPHLRLSLDYTNIEKTDNITMLTLQQVIDNESLLPGRVTRGANLPGDPAGWAGPITILDFRLVNLASGRVQAVDAQADYSLDAGAAGRFDAYAVATWHTDFTTRLSPTTPEVQNVGIGTFPLKFKANAGVSWTRGPLVLGWAMRYYDSYWVAAPSLPSSAPVIQRQGNGGRVSSQHYHDLFLQYRFPAAVAGGWQRVLQSTEITVGVRNIFDKEPPLDVNSSALQAFYSTHGSPRLASYYISLLRRF